MSTSRVIGRRGRGWRCVAVLAPLLSLAAAEVLADPAPAKSAGRDFSVTALPREGVAPFEVRFEILQHQPGEILRTTIDLDGDGDVDVSREADDRYLSGRYESVGEFAAKVRIVTTAGKEIVLTAPVSALDRAQVDAEIQRVWKALRSAFEAGDGEGALRLFTPDAEPRYRPAFTSPGTNLKALAADLGPIFPSTLGARYSDYVITRKASGADEAFLITFVRGRDGEWRISTL